MSHSAGHLHCAAVWGICIVTLGNTMFPSPVSGDTTFIMSSVISPGHPEYRDAASAEGEWALTWSCLGRWTPNGPCLAMQFWIKMGFYSLSCEMRLRVVITSLDVKGFLLGELCPPTLYYLERLGQLGTAPTPHSQGDLPKWRGCR